MTTPDALPPLSDEQRERIRARLMAIVCLEKYIAQEYVNAMHEAD